MPHIYFEERRTDMFKIVETLGGVLGDSIRIATFQSRRQYGKDICERPRKRDIFSRDFMGTDRH